MTDLIYSALEATPFEHTYEVEQERWSIELGDRAADELAMDDPIMRPLLTLLRIRNTSREQHEQDAR